MGKSVVPAQPDFLIQLRRTQHAVRTQLDAELAATGLTTPQYTVLAALEREGELSASDLAREFGMSAQTVNVLVTALEACGLLRRSRHPDHGRILLASLTEPGVRALEHGREVALTVQDRFLCRLTPSDRETLMGCLKAIEQTPTENATQLVQGFLART
jgi:DNA-binding MarR family transcriptional regulator